MYFSGNLKLNYMYLFMHTISDGMGNTPILRFSIFHNDHVEISNTFW